MWKTLSQLALKPNTTRFLLAKSKNTLSLYNSNSNASNFLSVKTSFLTCQSLRFESNKVPDMKTEFNKTSKPPVGDAGSSRFRNLLMIFISGGLTYFALSFYLNNRVNKSDSSNTINYQSQNLPGKVKPTISNAREKNPGNVKLTLYQYATCPFCSKVRAYLDYFGYSYDIVEVNSISKKQTDWSSYKKVPILAVQLPLVDNSNPSELKYDEKILVS